MRKFTKCLMTLGLLLVAGVASAKETVVYSLDYSTLGSYSFWNQSPEGSSYTLENGLLVINNTKKQSNFWDLQLNIAEGFTTAAGLDYKVNIEYKSTMEGSIWIGMGTGLDGNNADRQTWYGAPVSVNDDFQTLTWNLTSYPNSGKDNNYVIWQWGDLDGTFYIKKVEVIEIIPDAPKEDVSYELTDVTPTMYVKNYGASDPVAAIPDADGVYTVTDAATEALTWSTQFWIAGETALPEGRKFKVEFDYKASDAQTVPTQAHAAPGSYNHWACIGDVSFTDGWKHFEKEVTIEGDMGKNGGWQSIAFNMHRGTQVDGDTYSGSNTTYYIKNVTLKEEQVSGEAVGFSVGSIGWATFSCGKNVDLGTAKGYTAKFNGSYVELALVTEVPANNAVLIEGGGKYSFNVIASAAAIADNDLKVSDGTVEGDGTIYVLANKNSVPGFYKLASGQKVPAGKAYLKITSSAREFIGFDGATGIETVKTAKAEEGIFNLQGQRLMKAQKGLNIINGKKILVK